MKKWIVRIEYINRPDIVEIIYAKNQEEVETFMNIQLKDLLDSINGYEYEMLSRKKISSYKWQKKYDCPPYLMVGNWYGAECIKEWLEK